MDCTAASALAGACGKDTFEAAAPSAVQPAKASRCMTCPVRGQCIGSLAAEAGTHQLLRVLSGSRHLRQGECMPMSADSVYAVRSGSLKSLVPRGTQTSGFHFAGEVVGGGPLLRLVALQDTEVCLLRRDTAVASGASHRTCGGRLWEMMSRELLRERALASCLAALPAERRVLGVLNAFAQRARGTGTSSRGVALHLSATDIAEYLQVPGDTVERVLAGLAERGVLQRWPYQVGMVQPELLRREAS